MKASKWFAPAMTVIILITVLVGFWYLQSEINGLRQPNSSNSNPDSHDNTAPSNVAPQTIQNTTTTYGGTTLVCAWSSSNDSSAFLFINNGGSSIIGINYLNITNIGNATAYVTGYRIQAYYQNGTQAFDSTIRIDASGVYSSMQFPEYVPFTLAPGQSMSGDAFNERATDQHINQVGTAYDDVWASFIITPVWRSTPVD